MTGSLCTNRGIPLIVKTLSVKCLTKIHQQASAWMPHMLQHIAHLHLQCLFVRNVQSWLCRIFQRKLCWWESFSQWEKCAQLVKQRNARGKGNPAVWCAFLMNASSTTGNFFFLGVFNCIFKTFWSRCWIQFNSYQNEWISKKEGSKTGWINLMHPVNFATCWLLYEHCDIWSVNDLLWEGR